MKYSRELIRRSGRIYKNNKILVQNILGTAGLKGGSILISLAAMPAYLDFFNDSKVLGSWFTILSLLTFLSLFDFGVGNGLRNNIAAAVLEPDKRKARDLISAAYILAIAVASVIALAGYLGVRRFDWLAFFQLQQQKVSIEVIESTLLIVLATICIQLVLRNAISILYGLQKMLLANLCAVVTSVVILAFLTTGKTDNLEENLLNLAWIHLTATLAPLLIIHAILFWRILPGCIPRFLTNRSAFRKVGRLGLAFFSIQIALLVVNSTDQILVSYLFDSEDVVDYQIYLRVFTLVTVFFQLLTQPFWSAVTAAHVANNQKWIKKATRSLYLIASVGALLALFIVPTLQMILDLWLGSDRVLVVEWYAIVFVFLVFIEMLLYAGTTIANGTGLLRTQQLWMPVCALLKFPLAFLFASMVDAWVAVVLAHAIALVPIVIAQTNSLRKEGYLSRTS